MLHLSSGHWSAMCELIYIPMKKKTVTICADSSAQGYLMSHWSDFTDSDSGTQGS